MKTLVNSKLWYRFDYDGVCCGEYKCKSMCFDEHEETGSRIMNGAYQTKELNFIIRGDVLLKTYPEFTDNGHVTIGGQAYC